MTPSDYPALFRDADAAAAVAQRIYLRSLLLEYLLLFLASIFSLGLWETRLYYSGYALTFIALIALVTYRTVVSPEQAWYRCRALAESIKTSTWRFMMRAEPFQEQDRPETARQIFHSHLLSILQGNPAIAASLTGRGAGEQQVTPKMEAVRALSLAERRDLYGAMRVAHQRQWYVSRAARNRRLFRIWVAGLIIVYALGTIAALTRVAFPEATWLALDPLIVTAASVLGWIQVKKFNELSASYTLTAHEIAIVASRLADAQDETAFSSFINEAELAFSREHTQWVARQHGH